MISRNVLSGLLGVAIGLAAFVTGFGQTAPMRQSTTGPPKAETKKPPCTLTQASLPRVAGLQMGAPYEDVLAVYPEIANDAFFQKHLEADGSGLTHIQAASLFDEPAGDKTIEVGLFFKDRILVVVSNGSGPDKYRPIKKAVAEYSKVLGIDDDLWTIYFGTGAELRCVDFAFYANATKSDDPERANSMSIHSIQPEKK